MNIWVKKSIELANSPAYLDKLHAVYPMEEGALRNIPLDIQEQIKGYLEEENKEELIKALLKLELFPIKDPYVGYLRASLKSIEENPDTVTRIFNRLKKIGFSEIIRNSSQPKELNRTMGPMFKRWLPTIGYPMIPKNEFLNFEGTAFLEGSDTALKEFANKYLGTNLEKGLDLILKKRNVFILGESKFISAEGGNQNAQFNDPLGLISSFDDKKAIRIAVLDGVIWIQNNSLHRKIIKADKTIMSALLLKDYIESIK
jgi:hypothetical protein